MSDSADIRIAVIVPVLNDAPALAELADDLNAQSCPIDEIIVVSGSRDAQTDALAAAKGWKVLHTQASRGPQLNAGARASDSDILWFVHADARLPADACAAVKAVVARGAAGGGLRFRFAGRRTLMKRMLERLIALRIALGGIAYGDQALFCTRQAWQACDGFADAPLFEEVPLVRSLQRQQSFQIADAAVLVSSRRWERDGWLRRSLSNRWLALRFALGADPARLARSYRSKRTFRNDSRRIHP